MKCFVINLEQRTDRLDALEIPHLYTVHRAVDGSQFEHLPNNLRGHNGCRLSHISLLERIRELGLDAAIVFEDDVQLADDFEERFETVMKSLPEDWDLLYLGGWNRGIIWPYNDYLDIAEDVLCTHAYIIRSKFIDTVLNSLKNREWKVDVLMAEALPEGKCFICSPVLAWQRPGYSDIANKVTNNKHLLP